MVSPEGSSGLWRTDFIPKGGQVIAIQNLTDLGLSNFVKANSTIFSFVQFKGSMKKK